MRFVILNSTDFVPLRENKAKTSEKRGLANLDFEEHSLVDKLKCWSATMHSHKTRACASNLFFFFCYPREKQNITFKGRFKGDQIRYRGRTPEPNILRSGNFARSQIRVILGRGEEHYMHVSY